MTEVDPDDDSRRRWVLRWYRYDPDRHERRHTVIAAYDKKREFFRHFNTLSTELDRLKEAGEAEQVEHISGVEKNAGTDAKAREQRERLHDIRRRAAREKRDNARE